MTAAIVARRINSNAVIALFAAPPGCSKNAVVFHVGQVLTFKPFTDLTV
jgi:hypothetical protein